MGYFQGLVGVLLDHQEQAGTGDQGARDGDHLLLAAAEGAGELVLAFGEAGEALQHGGDAALHGGLGVGEDGGSGEGRGDAGGAAERGSAVKGVIYRRGVA